MKTRRLLLIGLVCAVFAWSVVVFAAGKARRKPVHNVTGVSLVEERPAFGSFFSLQRDQPPFPFNPFPEFGLYSFGNGVFAFDDLDFNYAARGTEMVTMSSPPDPGGGGSGTNDTNFYLLAYNYGSNDTWIEITGKTNEWGYFLIHTPETNTFFDLYGTTNLSPVVPGLNQTNWLWILRTSSGYTNLSLTNLLSSDQGFFQLGTMLDSDGDGLTDAFENLVSHTDPHNPDTDGDGISDYDEYWFGTSPLIPGSPPTLGDITIPKCPVP